MAKQFFKSIKFSIFNIYAVLKTIKLIICENFKLNIITEILSGRIVLIKVGKILCIGCCICHKIYLCKNCMTVKKQFAY